MANAGKEPIATIDWVAATREGAAITTANHGVVFNGDGDIMCTELGCGDIHRACSR